jgi:two-component system, NtrC family, response regulator AtoC
MSESTLRKVATTVLVADDEHAADIAEAVQEYCEKPVKAVNDLMEAMNFVHRHGDEPLIILLDLNWPYPNREGTYQFIDWLRGRLVEKGVPTAKDRIGPGQCGLILMSAYATAEERYAALKQGGGILKKPFDTDPVGLYTQLLALEDNLGNRRTRTKEHLLPSEVIGECEALIFAYKDARLAVDRRTPLWKDQHIFIFGERGTGKTELVRAIHGWLGLPGEPLHIDCGDLGPATDGQMAHGFFFGHVKGAFTDAVADQPGHFGRLTNQGLVHLDNLHCLNRAAQQPLIKFLETGCYTPVGGAKRSPKSVKARLVVTTSENPEERMLDYKLSEDVYRRLVHSNWFITIPSVRERGTDIILLARHFCSQWKVPEDATPPRQMRLSEGAEQALLTSLQTYHWRGNVSDVCGQVSRACRTAFLKERRELLPEDFAFAANGIMGTSAAPLTTPGNGTLKEVERAARCERVRSALRETKGNITAAARLLGVNRAHLQDEIIRACGIDIKEFRM